MRRSPAFVVALCVLGCLIGRSAGEPSNIISLSNIPRDADPPNRVGGFFLSCDSPFLRGPPVDFAFLCPTSPEEPDPDNSDGVSEAALTIEIGNGFADSEGEEVVVRFVDEAGRPVDYQVFLGADASIESETSIAPEDSPGFTVPVPAFASVTLVIETQDGERLLEQTFTNNAPIPSDPPTNEASTVFQMFKQDRETGEFSFEVKNILPVPVKVVVEQSQRTLYGAALPPSSVLSVETTVSGVLSPGEDLVATAMVLGDDGKDDGAVNALFWLNFKPTD